MKYFILGILILTSLKATAANDINRQVIESVIELEKNTGLVFSDKDQKEVHEYLNKLNHQASYMGTTLVCASVNVGLLVSMAFFACYDWSQQRNYTVIAWDVGGWAFAGGLGVLHFQHDERDSISGRYTCLTGGAASGWIGGSGLACITGGSPRHKYVFYGGWNGGAMIKASIAGLEVVRQN